MVLNNYYVYKNVIYSFDFNASFGNCIVYGIIEDEIYIDKEGDGTFNGVFINSLLKTDMFSGDGSENNVFNKDPRFVDIPDNNFAIDSLSPAKDIGNIEIARLFPFDLNNKSRLEDTGPDLGAYEW